MSSSSPKEIVIVGGGYVGIQFAQELGKLIPAALASITVIEKNEFMYHCIGFPRALVEPTYVNKLFVPLDNALPASHTKIVRAVAESIQEKEVIVHKIVDNQPEEATTSIPFDYLIIATGSSQVAPFKVSSDSYSRELVENSVVEVANHVKAAASVLVIGGGPVGVEVAGEIATAFPDKLVTILDANEKLISNAKMNEKFRTTLTNKLGALKVRLVLGEKFTDRVTEHGFEKKSLTTDKGTQIESDVQLVCIGMTPNVDLVRKLDESLLSDKGAVKVTPSLVLDDSRFPNIYAIGDVNNHPTPKMAYTGAMQGKHLAKQLAKVIKKGSGTVDPYVCSGPEAMILPLGPNGGVAQLPFFGGVVAGDMVVRSAKAKDYFAAKMWGTLHATLK